MNENRSDSQFELLRKGMDTVLKKERFQQWLDGSGSIGLNSSGGISRPAFGEDDQRIRLQVMDYMKDELGLQVRIDAWGNIFGKRAGSYQEEGVLLTGSHLDTVQNGGKYDGAAGVFCSLEAIRLYNELGIQTAHPLEIVVFAAEEANRMGISTVGSRGKTGRLKKSGLADFSDDQGVPLLDAIKKVGGDPAAMENDVYKPGDVKAFIEIHNEQMTRLEQSGTDLGIVVGVTGIRRRRFTIEGSAGHAGTVPMNQRQDALVAAADIIKAVRRAALAYKNDSVATIGHISVEPNSVNVVPGKVILELEIRSYYLEEIEGIDDDVWEAAKECQQRYAVHVERGPVTYDNAPRGFSPMIRSILTESAKADGLKTMDLVSMAGHDAYHMSYITNSGMMFVPSRNGKSHCPEEFTDPEYLVKATRTLALGLLLIDKEN